MNSTPIRTIRVEDELWERCHERAGAENTTVSKLIRGWLSDYAAGRSKAGPGRPELVQLSRAELTKLRNLIDKLLS